MKNFTLILLVCLLFSFISVQAQDSKNKLSLSPEIREQFIQKATAFRKEENYTAAVQQLDSILLNNSNDAGILLFKGDLQLQSKTFSEAVATYKELLPLNYETTITQINLSYALFMNHQPGKALRYAANAWKGNSTNLNAVINYFNAMLWNSQTKEAAVFLQKNDSLLTPAQQLVLKARLYTTSGDYTSGLKYYDSLVNTYPDKYYVQEYAEVLLGKKEIEQSAATMKANEKLFSANEYKAFQEKWNAAQLQNAGTEFVYFKDVAKNIRIENSVWWQQRAGRVYRFTVSAGTSVISSAQSEKTKAQFAHVHIAEKWNKAWSGETELHLQLIQPSGGNSFTGITGKQSVQYQPNDRRMLGLFYNAEILNFTASLLDKNIRSNSAGYVTHIMLNGKTGIYSQGSAGVLTDKNQRYQFFGSVYHLLKTEPTLKAGLNFSALHFKDNTIKNYFSPNRYLNSEIFVDYSTALPMLSKFYVQVQAAAGLQQIEQQQWQAAYRIQTELGIRLKHLETSLKYQTSNTASATGTGYSFNWYTFKLMWKW